VAIDRQGNVTAVWGENTGIWANRFTTDAGWGTAEWIGDGGSATVDMDGSGNAIAVWTHTGWQDDVPTSAVVSSRFSVESGWGPPEVLSGTATNCVGTESVVSSSGDAFVVWQQYDAEYGTSVWANRTSVWANRYVLGSGWGEPELVDVDAEGSSYTPEVAVDGAGNAIVVWRRREGDRLDLRANTFCRAP